MSDDIDRAQNEVERSLGEALRSRKPEGPAATGRCLYCGTGFLNLRLRWCDAECRDEREVLTKQKR